MRRILFMYIFWFDVEMTNYFLYLMCERFVLFLFVLCVDARREKFKRVLQPFDKDVLYWQNAFFVVLKHLHLTEQEIEKK